MLAAVLLSPGFNGQRTGSATVETAAGLHIMSFDTIHGIVAVNLPDDVSASDTISGTVIIEPSGKTETERRLNLEELKKYAVQPEKDKPFLMPIEDVFTIQGRGTVATGRVFKWTAPSTDAGGTSTIILTDQAGKTVARGQLPILATPTEQPTARTPAAFQLPVFGQTGKPLQILGPFDGDFASTSVRVNNNNATLLAESPRQVIFASPANVVGPAEIQLKERDVSASGRYNNLQLNLSAEKTTLKPEETTVVNVLVRGLEGLQTDAPLKFEKVSGGVAVEGGDKQLITIKPASVQPGGIYRTNRTVTGINPGDFVIKATVVVRVIPSGTQGGLKPPTESPAAPPSPTTPPTTSTSTPAAPEEPKRHFVVAPKCVCFPPEDKLVIDITENIRRIEVGWMYGPRFDSAEGARKKCEEEALPKEIEICRGKIIKAILEKIRGACKLSEKIDPKCAAGTKCTPSDTSGMPTAEGITSDGKCTTQPAHPPADRTKTIYIGNTGGTCSFKGTIYVLCDP